MPATNEPNPGDERNHATAPTSPKAEQRGARYFWEMEQARRRAVRDLVEQRIEEAREEGKFENLSGKGKPLPRHEDTDIWAGDRALAYHLLKSNDVTPPELDRGREIDVEMERAEESVRSLRHYRDTLAARRTVFASDRRAYNIQRDATERSYEEALRTINSKILSLNIIAPAAFHRRSISVERRVEAFRAEFPRLPE